MINPVLFYKGSLLDEFIPDPTLSSTTGWEQSDGVWVAINSGSPSVSIGAASYLSGNVLKVDLGSGDQYEARVELTQLINAGEEFTIEFDYVCIPTGTDDELGQINLLFYDESGDPIGEFDTIEFASGVFPASTYSETWTAPSSSGAGTAPYKYFSFNIDGGTNGCEIEIDNISIIRTA